MTIDDIPEGPYCYTSLDAMDSNGHMKINGMCPFWTRTSESILCTFLGEKDDIGLLDDQVKICGVKDND